MEENFPGGEARAKMLRPYSIRGQAGKVRVRTDAPRIATGWLARGKAIEKGAAPRKPAITGRFVARNR
jgi:hypothetical protein